MIEINSCPFWDHDDISGCARRKYIEFRFPLVILLTTLIYTFHIVFRERKNHRSESALEHQCETPEPGEHGNESRKDTRFSILRLNPAAENCGISSIKNDKSSFDKFKVFLEGVLIVIQFTIHLYALLNIPVDHKEFSQQSLLVKNFLWFFLLVVVSLRLFTTSQSLRWVKACQCNLWAVSLLSYALVFALSVISLRSVLIGKIEEKILVKYTIIEFCINLVLFLLLFTSNIEGINYSFLVEGENKTLPPNPTVFSLLTFARIDLLIWKAYKHCLENADVWDLNINDKSVTILKNLEKCSTHKTLLSNIMFYFKITFLSQLLLAFVTSVLTLVPLLLLPRILSYVDDPTSQSWNLMSLYVVFMLISRIVATTCRGQGLFLGEKGTMQLRTILVSHIYSKTLRRTILRDSTTSEQENDSQPHVPESLEENNDYFGSEAKPNVETSRKDNSVNNLMSVDAFKVSEGMSTFYLACEAMFMITMALIILYSLLGWSAFAGIFALLTMIPLNFWCATFYGKYQTDQLVLTDKRTSGISEALNSMRVIKLLAWEKIFYQNIVGVRNGEIRLLKKKGTIFFLNHLIWFFGPTLISVVTFSVFIKFQKQKLSPSIAFTALSLFAILRTPMDQITSTISLLIQSSISVQRIQDYLNEPDTRKYEILTLNKTRIGFEEADMEWEATETSFKLKHISIEFKQNSLNAIVCPTGSGKSSLLLGLLGELNLRSGRIYVPSVDSRNDLEIGFDGMANSMAYSSQSPWLITGTIEDNIVFGEVVNQQKLDAVIRSCCLDRDFKTMTAGSKTDVGGGGLSLSGGQQQRIALARAVYSSSRYLLLDDCLSTVDPETALHIYEQCLCSSSILKGRTCIITSHNISLITKWAHWLVILDNGEVEAQGTPSDLIESNNFLTECMNNDIGDECNSQLKPEPPTKSNGTRSVDSKRTNLQDEEDVQEAARIENSVETKMEGSVKFSTYKWLANYFGGIWIVFFFTLSSAFIYGITLSQGFWLRYWLENGSFEPRFTWFHSILQNSHSNVYFLSIYTIIGLFSSFLTAGKVWVAIISGTNASKKIFAKMLSSIFQAKLRFHDITPIGRIMNRFSKDIDVIDQQLIPNFEGLFYSVVVCLSIVFLIGYVTPRFLLFAAPLCVLYYIVGTLYLRASRELKRIDNINVSPIHQLFTEAIKGVVTIRALADERRFITHTFATIDRSNAPFFLSQYGH